MAVERLSDHCSLMTRPDGPPRPKVRPNDCPPNAAFINGGDGNDSVTIYGKGDFPLIFDGGKGDDSVSFKPGWMIFAHSMRPIEVLALVGTGIFLATLAIIVWRALAETRR